jgi:hypothetical protein
MIGWSSSSLRGRRWTGVVLFPSHSCCCVCAPKKHADNIKINVGRAKRQAAGVALEDLVFLTATGFPRKRSGNGWRGASPDTAESTKIVSFHIFLQDRCRIDEATVEGLAFAKRFSRESSFEGGEDV